MRESTTVEIPSSHRKATDHRGNVAETSVGRLPSELRPSEQHCAGSQCGSLSSTIDYGMRLYTKTPLERIVASLN